MKKKVFFSSIEKGKRCKKISASSKEAEMQKKSIKKMGVFFIICSFFFSFIFSVTMPLCGKTSEVQTVSRKLVVCGDGACGKTSLLSVFTRDYFPQVLLGFMQMESSLTHQ